jgi:hypothetical protein
MTDSRLEWCDQCNLQTPHGEIEVVVFVEGSASRDHPGDEIEVPGWGCEVCGEGTPNDGPEPDYEQIARDKAEDRIGSQERAYERWVESR